MKKQEMPPVPVETVSAVEVDDSSLGESIITEIQERPSTAKRGDRIRSVLSEEEIEEVRAKARKQIEAEKVKHAKDKLLQQELAKLKSEEGVGGVEDDMVRIPISLPVFTDCIKINGKPYYHGVTYDVPRHIARTLQDQMFMCHKHQAKEIRGIKMAEFYRSPRQTVLGAGGAVQNGPQRSG